MPQLMRKVRLAGDERKIYRTLLIIKILPIHGTPMSALALFATSAANA
jgi:hypothetical protein